MQIVSRRIFQIQMGNIAKYPFVQSIPSYFKIDPWQMSGQHPHKSQNFVNGQWKNSQHYQTIVDPMNGEQMLKVPDTQAKEELKEFVESIKSCPISGLHNPLKNPERFLQYGDVMHQIAAELRKQEVLDFFTKLIQRVIPKHTVQAQAEVIVSRKFFENFSGDQPRFLMRSFNIAGDRNGQQSSGYRWPYGAVGLITPFNFPFEIPCLQIFGALMTGNKVFFKGDSRVNVVMEQFLRMALHLGLPPTDIDLMFGNGQSTEYVVKNGQLRNLLFTGSSKVAEHLTQITNGKIRIEDAGFDWKILGPDVPHDQSTIDYILWQSDQDAYACSGQKCSAQSIVFHHENWHNVGIYKKLEKLASTRNLRDLSLGPILTWNNTQIKDHIKRVLEIPGSKILFGGKEIIGHQVPAQYGVFEPTAIFVPLDKITNNKEYFNIVTTEVFGPFQIITEFKDHQLPKVLDCINSFSHHLTAGVVSNDINFIRQVTANTVNGVTYTGIRARTTGAPQNHFFGPCGDPRGAGIGTAEAILNTWTTHREIIIDNDQIPRGWKGHQS